MHLIADGRTRSGTKVLGPSLVNVQATRVLGPEIILTSDEIGLSCSNLEGGKEGKPCRCWCGFLFTSAPQRLHEVTSGLADLARARLALPGFSRFSLSPGERLTWTASLGAERLLPRLQAGRDSGARTERHGAAE